MKQEWHKCDICFSQKYCSEEEFRNHREDCVYERGKSSEPIPLDPSTHDCPMCGGNMVRAGHVRYCQACGAAIGGGSCVLQ